VKGGWLIRQSPNRRRVDAIRQRHICQRLTGIDAGQGFPPLMSIQLARTAELDGARLSTLATVTRTGRKKSARTQRGRRAPSTSACRASSS
jgi:hypothetical protein